MEAEQLLDKILEQNPKELGALVARGTARALRRELKGAEADFTAAIAIEPRCEGVLPVERVGSLWVHKVGVSSGITVAVHLYLQVPGHLAPWPGAQCAG